MELKTFFKGIGMYFFAEALCLFLALTLSAIGGTLLRIISYICTIGILICLCINFAINRGNEDRLAKRENTFKRRLFLASSISLIYGILGICLLLARSGILADGFYRWYKLLDAPFLQLCNLCSKDVTASTLSWCETALLAAVNLLPFLVTWIAYTLTRKGVSLEELQYRKK